MVAPTRNEGLWTDFIGCLLRLLRPRDLQPAIQEAPEPGTKPTARDLKRWATSSLLMESVLAMLVELYRFGMAAIIPVHASYERVFGY